MNSFFMVWNPVGRAPTHRHPDIASAQTEAKRLARANEGHEFYVLAAVGRAQFKVVNYEDIPISADELIPF